MKKINGFDDCIVGTVERFGMQPILCYDKLKMISKLILDEELTMSEAMEHFEFNILGAWVGSDTPCFLIGGNVLNEELE